MRRHEPSHLDLSCLQKSIIIACGSERVNGCVCVQIQRWDSQPESQGWKSWWLAQTNETNQKWRGKFEIGIFSWTVSFLLVKWLKCSYQDVFAPLRLKCWYHEVCAPSHPSPPHALWCPLLGIGHDDIHTIYCFLMGSSCFTFNIPLWLEIYNQRK